MPVWFGRLGITTAYFRGKSETEPEACKDAFDFVKNMRVKKKMNETVSPCHRIYAYGKFENGDEFFESGGALPATASAYASIIANLIDKFDKQYDNHLYKPPAANAEFTVEDGWLQATPETEQIYVPFTRTNDVTRVETNRLVVTFPDKSVVTTNVAWEVGSENMEVPVKKPAKKGWGKEGERIRLELLSTNGVSVATNFITCVAATNSFLLPSTNRLESAGLNPWGVWTLLEGAATNQLPKAVSAANGHFVTHDTPTPISSEIQASFDVTNRLTVVTTNDLSAFPSFDAVAWTELTNLVAQGSVYEDVNHTFCATNGFSAWTNAVAMGGDALRPQTRTVALDTVTITNFVAGEEALKPVETFTTTTTVEATNELSGVFATLGTTHAVAFPFTVAVALPATNVVSALADGDHPADTASTNATPVAFSVTVLTVARTLEAVRGGSEAVRAPDNGDVPVEQRHEQVWTDPAFTTNLVNGTTTAYTARDVVRTKPVVCTVTNTTYYIFGNENGTASTADDPDLVSCPFTYTLTTNYYDVTRDQYTGGDIRAFQLRVTGGLVWDERVRRLTNTFDSAAFKTWCAASNVVCTVIDQRDAATGASLFTHAQATNGMRGTSFLSRNGLREDKGRSPEGDMFKVELIRPDGTTEDGTKVYENGVQKATGQTVWSTTDPMRFATVAGALDTLNSALDLAKGDPTENLNDDPSTTPLTLAFNTVTNQTLSALDTVDVFRLTGAYTNTAVAFTLTNKTDNAVLSFTVCDKAGRELVPALDPTNRVWVFKTDDAVFVKVSTTNALLGTVAYEVGATNAPPRPGTVGFKMTEAEVTEGTTNAFSIVVTRTGYTGAASCTVSLDEARIPEVERARYRWPGDQTVTWDDLESGDKTVEIGLVDDGIWHGQTALPFTLTVPDDASVAVEAGKAAFTLNYRDDEVESVGELALATVRGNDLYETGNGRLYARADSFIRVEVTRRGGSCSNVTGRIVASKADADVSPDAGQQWFEKSSETNKTFEVRLPSVTGAAKGLDLVLTLEGAGIPVAKGENRVTIRVLPAASPTWGGEAVTDNVVAWTGIQYTKFEHSVELAGDGDLVSLQKISTGAVPAGLKATLDKTDRRLVVSGTPTAAVTNGVTLVYQAKARVEGVEVYTFPVTLHITIKALADVNGNFAGDGAKAKRVWTGLALLDKAAVDEADADAEKPARRLRGLLDLTVSPNGRTSAKWRTVEGKTVSFSAAGFAEIDEANGDVTLGATRVVAGVTNTLTATLCATGGLDVAVVSNGVDVATGTVPADAGTWSKDHPATDYVGTYVAAFPVDNNWVEMVTNRCSGTATLTFRLAAGAARTGRTTFAGVLPNGRTFSGSATLFDATRRGGAGTSRSETSGEGATERAMLPVLAASATDAFAAVLDIANGAEVGATEGTEPFWAHRERNFASLSYDPALTCVGARWTAPDKEQVAALPLDVQEQDENGNVVASTRLRLNRTSGVVQGTLRVGDETGRLVTRTARGVLVPGDETGFVPFGAWWWNETEEKAERDDGATVRKTVRVGVPLEDTSTSVGE